MQLRLGLVHTREALSGAMSLTVAAHNWPGRCLGKQPRIFSVGPVAEIDGYCTNCGTARQKGQNYCGNCGAALGTASAAGLPGAKLGSADAGAGSAWASAGSAGARASSVSVGPDMADFGALGDRHHLVHFGAERVQPVRLQRRHRPDGASEL